MNKAYRTSLVQRYEYGFNSYLPEKSKFRMYRRDVDMHDPMEALAYRDDDDAHDLAHGPASLEMHS